ncbi:MAG: DUF1957 domain-containing protein [Alphaproteobacteria bacterium]|nr:DUF1957 domain-containing protein [Alphaproteobacteria bacterium]
MSRGYLALVLHAHMPFIRHPEYPSYLEEDWLFEAITETYLPLLEVFDELHREGVPFHLSMTLTPPLVAMLDDALLQERYVDHLEQLIQLASEEVGRRTGHVQWLAERNLELFRRRLAQYTHRHGGDLVGAFADWQDRGNLEILTCGATHGFLPLMQSCPEAVRAQIEVAIDSYRRRFCREPRGIWLPECGYFPGLDAILRDAGIRWFIGEGTAIQHATPRPVYGVYAPVYTPSGVAVFGRDPETSAQVWSAESGYPGHPDYREFHRDLGYTAPFDEIAPYVQPTGLRKNVGIKYHRITGKTERKEYYDPWRARRVADEHAADFVRNREQQVAFLSDALGRAPIITAPYDAELFGHWWYEGPQFVGDLFRHLARSRVVESITPSAYLARHPEQQVVQPNLSSWGANSYADVWLHESNEWIYPHLLVAARHMTDLANRFARPDALQDRALRQAARELLLAQSSDWAFILQTNTSTQYASQRTVDHLERFRALYDGLVGGGVDPAVLANIEARDTLFPDIDWRVYRSR